MNARDRTGFLSYWGEDLEPAEPPSRIYARIDQVEQLGGEPRGELAAFGAAEAVALLDSVDASWFDEVGINRKTLATSDTIDEADKNVSVVAVDYGRLSNELGRPPTPYHRWLEVELGPPRRGPLALHYLNLYAAPAEQSVQSASWVETPLDRALASKTSMDDIPDATENDLEAEIGRLAPPLAAAVYDVGQGGCSAVLAFNSPSLYFDLGGGVLANRATYPAALRKFCFTRQPLIMLSHWDWDHWSSANRDPEAFAQTWILPRQSAGGLGAVHRTFLARILQHGRALVWPDSLEAIRVGGYQIVKCTGPQSKRNESGLALVIENPNYSPTRHMLFPGDCGYDHVPSADSLSFTSVVAPHHGGLTGGRGKVPSSDQSSAGRVVYSYGEGNSYGHPRASVCCDHVNGGWQHTRETPSRCPARNGLDHDILGHVHLYWDESESELHPACTGSVCQLSCHQR